MYFFLIPILTGFGFNWASEFTYFYSRRWGEGRGRLITFVFRNILGIPVWAFGIVLAFRRPAQLLYSPGTVVHMAGWLLIGAGTALMIWALVQLRLRSFRPTGTDTLVSSGIFRYIRHPIYTGLLLDFAGGILMRPALPPLIACLLGCLFVCVQARFEEIDLVVRIPAYREYMQRVPRFFPRLRRR